MVRVVKMLVSGLLILIAASMGTCRAQQAVRKKAAMHTMKQNVKKGTRLSTASLEATRQTKKAKAPTWFGKDIKLYVLFAVPFVVVIGVTLYVYHVFKKTKQPDDRSSLEDVGTSIFDIGDADKEENGKDDSRHSPSALTYHKPYSPNGLGLPQLREDKTMDDYRKDECNSVWQIPPSPQRSDRSQSVNDAQGGRSTASATKSLHAVPSKVLSLRSSQSLALPTSPKKEQDATKAMRKKVRQEMKGVHKSYTDLKGMTNSLKQLWDKKTSLNTQVKHDDDPGTTDRQEDADMQWLDDLTEQYSSHDDATIPSVSMPSSFSSVDDLPEDSALWMEGRSLKDTMLSIRMDDEKIDNDLEGSITAKNEVSLVFSAPKQLLKKKAKTPEKGFLPSRVSAASVSKRGKKTADRLRRGKGYPRLYKGYTAYPEKRVPKKGTRKRFKSVGARAKDGKERRSTSYGQKK